MLEMNVEMNIEQQVDEIELLQSMYSSPGEFQVDDQASYDKALAYTRQRCAEPPKCLSIKLFILVNAHQDSDSEDQSTGGATGRAGDGGLQYRLEVLFRLTNSYPDTQPEVYMSSNELHGRNQDSLNSDLRQFITTLPEGEPHILLVLDWIKDNASGYFPIPIPHTDTVDPESDSSTNKCFCRMWLYMHHIYSKTKRRNILAYASDLDLTGFCLPGKPGVVCIEGTDQNVREFYSVLRRWNWKSITCRKREVNESCDVPACRKIVGFRELVLDMHGHRSNHMDMGQFLAYLKEHGLEYMFKELFGVDGRGVG